MPLNLVNKEGNSSMLKAILLTSAAEISKAFRINRKAVVMLMRLGAPIFKIGDRYNADYGRLLSWFENSKEVDTSLKKRPPKKNPT